MPRRTRFTVTASCAVSDKIEKHVILAYSAADAQNYYEARGWVVLAVARGDYRKAERSAPAGGGFRVDYAALKVACDLLGLKLPVRLRFNSRYGRTLGNYRLGAGYHDIMLKSYRTAEQASSTLWHELTHAMQAERAGGTIEAWQAERVKSYGKYQRCPLEIEARNMSADMADLPLCY